MVHAGIPAQRQHGHGGVVVVQHFALRRLANQLRHRRLDRSRGFRDDLALGRGGQRNAQILLQVGQAVPRKPTPAAEQGDHAGRCRVILLLAHAFGNFGREHFPTQIAAQLLQLVHGSCDRRLTFDPHQTARIVQRVHLATLALRAAVPLVQRRMGNCDPARSAIRLGAVAPMTGRWLLRSLYRCQSPLARATLHACLFQYRLGLLDTVATILFVARSIRCTP